MGTTLPDGLVVRRRPGTALEDCSRMGHRTEAEPYPGDNLDVTYFCIGEMSDKGTERGTNYAPLHGKFMGYASPMPQIMTISRTARSVPKAAEKSAIALSLSFYTALLVYIIPRHEPWSDEAQAWELAKSLSLKDLFGTYIHYEASPGLWHSLLWLLAKAHVSYSGMHWFTATIVLVAMALLTTRAPFPLGLRLLLPFTYFFSFQYAVVARSYALFPVLLFALAWQWPRRRRNPLSVVILIGLLGNVSAHGLVVAIGLGLVLAIEYYLLRPEEPGRGRQLLVCSLLLVAMLGFAFWNIAPAADAGWVLIADWHGTQNRMAAKVGSLQPVEPTANVAFVRLRFAGQALERLARVLDHGLAEYHLGLIAWGLLVWGWIRGRLLRYCLPLVLLWGFCSVFPFQFYHAGLFWVLFLFLWWVTTTEEGEQTGVHRPKSAWRQKALFASVTVCVIFQLIWTARAIRYDASTPYSPHRDAAVILNGYLRRGATVDLAIPATNNGGAEFNIAGIEPYFETEPISNMPFRFWFWGAGFDGGMRTKYLQDSANHDAVILVVESGDQRSVQERLESIGYRRNQVVCGQMFYPDYLYTQTCYAFYEP